MAKDAYWFPHDYNARNDRKILKLRRKHGTLGYGVYFIIVEMLRDTKDYSLPLDSVEDIAFELREEDDLVKSVICDFDLFIIEDDCFFSESLNQRMEKNDYIKEQRSLAGKKSAEARRKKKQNSTSVEQVLEQKSNTVERVLEQNSTRTEQNRTVHNSTEQNRTEQNKKKEKIYQKGNQESLLFDDDGEQILKKEEKPKEKTSAKKEKVDWKEGFDELFKIEEFSTSWDEYLKARKTKATPRAKQLALKKLVDMSGNDIDLSIKILEQSIMNGYQGLFPLKTQHNGYTQQKPKPTSQLERTTGKTRDELDAEWSDDHTTAYLNQVLAEQAKYR